MRYSSRYTFIAMTLCASLLTTAGCDNTSQPSKSTQKYLPFEVPELNTAYYGILAIHGGTGQVAFSEYSDAGFNSQTFTLPTTTSASAYYGGGDAVTGLTVNGLEMPSSGTGSGLHYYETSPTLYTDGTTNTFSWTAGGANYSSNISGDIGSIAIASPAFNSSVNKANDLTITWTPSSDADDYVQIALQGKPDEGNATSVGEYDAFFDDNGSATIPSSVFAGFSEHHMRIILTRGKYIESQIGGQDFLTAMYNSDRIDVDLN